MPLWAVILGWFFGCSGLLVLNAHLSELRPRLRISHVDEKTGLTWTTGLGTGQSPAYDNVLIIMNQLHANRLGINLVHNQQKVSRVVFKEAFNAGWRVGDEILEVDGKKVRSNRAIQNAVRRVVAQKKLPVNFKVRRWAVPDGSRGMIQLTNKGRREHLVPMVDIVRAILKDFHIVLFMDGTLQEPRRRLDRQIVHELDAQGLPFKAIDCTDEKANPEIRRIVKKICGEEILPQLFINGTHVAGGRAIIAALKKKIQKGGKS